MLDTLAACALLVPSSSLPLQCAAELSHTYMEVFSAILFTRTKRMQLVIQAWIDSHKTDVHDNHTLL